MKKIYSKVLVSAFVAASSFFGAQAEEVVVLQENFDKLETAMEAGVHKYGKNPWTGKDVEGVEYQPNYTTIQTDGNVADLNGWSSRTTYMYACQGFIRISKTSFGGDLVSPKFASLSKPTDVKLSWQGIGYTSLIKLDEAGEYKSGGVHDHQYYYVAVLGAGEIEGASKMNKVAYKDENMNDIEVNAALVKIPTDCFVTMDTLQAWTFEGTKNELTIKGATAETQVVFMSTLPNFTKTKTTDYSTAEMPLDENAPHGVNKKVNRVIFDNIKVVVADPSGVNDINVAKEVKVRKVIENGQVLIISGDKKYNLMGAEVK